MLSTPPLLSAFPPLESGPMATSNTASTSTSASWPETPSSSRLAPPWVHHLSSLKPPCGRRDVSSCGVTEFAFYEYGKSSESENTANIDGDTDIDEIEDDSLDMDDDDDDDDEPSEDDDDDDDNSNTKDDNGDVTMAHANLDTHNHADNQGDSVVEDYYRPGGKRRRKYRRYKHALILLRRDSGWSFSEEAFLPPYLRKRYTLCKFRGSPTDSTLESQNTSESLPVAEIYLTEEDKKLIWSYPY